MPRGVFVRRPRLKRAEPAVEIVSHETLIQAQPKTLAFELVHSKEYPGLLRLNKVVLCGEKVLSREQVSDADTKGIILNKLRLNATKMAEDLGNWDVG